MNLRNELNLRAYFDYHGKEMDIYKLEDDVFRVVLQGKETEVEAKDLKLLEMYIRKMPKTQRQPYAITSSQDWRARLFEQINNYKKMISTQQYHSPDLGMELNLKFYPRQHYNWFKRFFTFDFLSNDILNQIYFLLSRNFKKNLNYLNIQQKISVFQELDKIKKKNLYEEGLKMNWRNVDLNSLDMRETICEMTMMIMFVFFDIKELLRLNKLQPLDNKSNFIRPCSHLRINNWKMDAMYLNEYKKGTDIDVEKIKNFIVYETQINHFVTKNSKYQISKENLQQLDLSINRETKQGGYKFYDPSTIFSIQKNSRLNFSGGFWEENVLFYFTPLYNSLIDIENKSIFFLCCNKMTKFFKDSINFVTDRNRGEKRENNKDDDKDDKDDIDDNTISNDQTNESKVKKHKPRYYFPLDIKIEYNLEDEDKDNDKDDINMENNLKDEIQSQNTN